jgi:hypothetical protein
VFPADLLKTATSIIDSTPNKPRQSDLRRAVSTAYYAMFHTLSKSCADLLVGTASRNRSKPAWHQMYRALEHKRVKGACECKKILPEFPADIQDFANLFVEMQAKRHKADYDPLEKFFKSAVVIDVGRVTLSIKKYTKVNIKDRRAFAVFVLMGTPRS